MMTDPRTPPLVMIIDDDRVQRMSVQFVLNREGYRVEEAGDGKEALARLAELPVPDLILLDVILPELDGFEVCRELRKMPLLAEVPVLMITSLDGVATIDHAFQNGATDFISKPIEWPIFRQRVRRLAHVGHVRQALESTQARERTILDHIGDGVIVADAFGKVVKLNRAAAELFGVVPAAAVGLPIWHFFAEPLPISAALDELITTRARRSNSVEVPVEVSIRDVPHWTGDFRVAVVRDISPRLEAEKRLGDIDKVETRARLLGAVLRDLTEKLTAVFGHGRSADEALAQAVTAAHECQSLVARLRSDAGDEISRPVAELSRLDGLAILVVDDEESVINMARAMLQSLGAEVLASARSHDALEIVRAAPRTVDVLVVNLNMPHLNGEQLIRAIRQFSPDLPAVVLCSQDPGDHAAGLRKLGGTIIVRKPFTRDELARAVRTSADRRPFA